MAPNRKMTARTASLLAAGLTLGRRSQLEVAKAYVGKDAEAPCFGVLETYNRP